MWSISQTYPSATSPPPALQRSPAIALLIALRELFAGSRGPQSCLAPPGSNFQRPLVDTRPGVAPDLNSFIARLYIRESNPVGPTQLFETSKEVVLWSQETGEKRSGARVRKERTLLPVRPVSKNNELRCGMFGSCVTQRSDCELGVRKY